MLKKHVEQKAILRPAAAAKHYTLQLFPPSEDLAPYVEHYWIVRWRLPQGVEFTSEILPNPSVNVSLMPGRSVVTGVVTRKFTWTLVGDGTVLGIRFRAGGFFPFYGRPVSALTDKVVPLLEIFNTDSEWIDQISGRSSDINLTLRAEDLLRGKRPKPDDHITTVNEVLRFCSEHGVRQVRAVAKLTGLSERTLQHLFRKYVGVGLKWVIDRFRLQDAAALIASGKMDWATIAADCGYADQAHFIRDFKNILGETPAQYGKR